MNFVQPKEVLCVSFPRLTY